MKAVQEFGEIQDGCVYTAETIAKRIGRSLKSTKELLRDHFEIVDLGTLILVSGLNFRLGIERMSRHGGADGEDPARAATRRPRTRRADAR